MLTLELWILAEASNKDVRTVQDVLYLSRDRTPRLKVCISDSRKDVHSQTEMACSSV